MYVGHGRLAKASNTWVCFLQGRRTGDSLPRRRNLLAPLTGNKIGVNASVSSVNSQHYFDSVGHHNIIFNVKHKAFTKEAELVTQPGGQKFHFSKLQSNFGTHIETLTTGLRTS